MIESNDVLAKRWLTTTIAAVPVRRYVIAKENHDKKRMEITNGGMNPNRSKEISSLKSLYVGMRQTIEDFLAEWLDNQGRNLTTELIRLVLESAVQEMTDNPELLTHAFRNPGARSRFTP